MKKERAKISIQIKYIFNTLKKKEKKQTKNKGIAL